MEPDQQIESTLAAVYRKHGFQSVETSTPLTSLLEKDAESDAACADAAEITVWEAKSEGMRLMLGWIFEKGVDPRVALRRLYALAAEVGPQHLKELTHEERALLLGDGAGRATSQARSKAIFGGLKSALGITTHFGGVHKTPAACARMSAAQKGNSNRRGQSRPELPRAA